MVKKGNRELRMIEIIFFINNCNREIIKFILKVKVNTSNNYYWDVGVYGVILLVFLNTRPSC